MCEGASNQSPDLKNYTAVMGKRGNVVGIEPGASRFKIQHSNELK